MTLNECINFLLTNAQNSVFLYFKKSLQDLEVTPIQYATLKCLWEQDGELPSQLAETLCLDSSTVTGILGRLEEKGLIKRSFCKDDRRKVTVSLTEKGRSLEAPVSDIIKQCNIDVQNNLSQEEINELHRLLKAVTETANGLLR